MTSNTTVNVYQASEEKKKQTEKEFDWGKIISSSDRFTKNEFNPHIYERENTYSIFADGKNISVHPGNDSTVRKAIYDLTSITSDYYRCDCRINGDFSHLIVIVRYS